MRVVRSWNQTGQKHAGDPDIAKSLLPAHNYVLWILVLLTYVNVARRMSRNMLPSVSRAIAISCSIALCLAALGFKVAFTKADAPELLVGLESLILRPMEEFSLVAQARAVFIGIAALACLIISQHGHRSRKPQLNVIGSCLDLRRSDTRLTSVSRINLASARSGDIVSNNRVSGHQHSPIPPFRVAIPYPAIVESVNTRNSDGFRSTALRFILCFRWIQRHIFYRPFQRLQRHKRI